MSNHQQYFECPKCASDRIFSEKDFYYCHSCKSSNSYELRYGRTVEEDFREWLK